MVAWWLVLSPHSKKALGLIPTWGIWGPLWVGLACSRLVLGFLPQTKDVQLEDLEGLIAPSSGVSVYVRMLLPSERWDKLQQSP